MSTPATKYITEYDPKTNSGKTVAIITSPKQSDKIKRPLTVKQRKFVAEVVSGKPKSKAYTAAGYSATTDDIARANASRLASNDNVQQAINDALELHEATPEFAVRRLKAIAEQSEELGASRLASKDILELHGWRKNERPTVSLTVNQAFFGKSRNKLVEGESV